ncbi:MAG: hydantoinase/oxoprolinase family protein [Thermoleophilaceae bacterium]|nr:hydantoinase/oxoprolinase family protein [Thermoleophilaceae bacterium]
MARTPQVLAIDAGGTMTDTFIVDESGGFVVGKAQTTPEDESVGFMKSSADALGQWQMSVAEGFPQIRSGVFSGTAMLNRLLSRQGIDVGVIVTAGQEDCLKIERGIQTYLGFSYGDRLHVSTHHHNQPLVPRRRIHGVRGRIDLFGVEALPLREQDVRDAVDALLAEGVRAIVVSLLFSYRNQAHEERVGGILREAVAAAGVDVPVMLSSELYPTRRDLPRLNSTVIEAYAAEPSRATLRNVSDKTREGGAGFELRVMASHGGTISIDAKELGTTLISGPIGGVVGAQWLAERSGIENVLCTDIGGTSFDIALITDGRFEVTPTPDMARFVLNMPLVKIDSLGAGCGSYVRVDPASRRPELGPDSAGAAVGVCNPESGVETVSVTDLNLLLGRLNPDYFLGGEVPLDVERARHAVEKQIAAPMGLSVDDAAAGIVDLFETKLRNEAVGRVLGKGYSPAEYTLLCYGGGGPLHVAGYTSGVPFEQVLIPAWAAGFSAFGCACADFEYRYDRTVDLPVLPSMPPEGVVGIGAMLSQAWRALEDRVAVEFEKSGYALGDIRFVHSVRMQYFGQLNDIEIDSPHASIETADQMNELITRFEDSYGTLYAASAKSPELGYLVTQAIVRGAVEVEKPRLPRRELQSGSPPVKHSRSVNWGKALGTTATDVYEMEDVVNGHSIEGPAVIEAPSTTFAIPPDRRAWIDTNDIFHLENKEA